MFKSNTIGIVVAVSALLGVTSTAMAYDRQASEAAEGSYSSAPYAAYAAHNEGQSERSRARFELSAGNRSVIHAYARVQPAADYGRQYDNDQRRAVRGSTAWANQRAIDRQSSEASGG